MPRTKKASFEAALQELETVTAALEGGELTLAELLALYERGVKLAGSCEARLSETEAKISLLSQAIAAKEEEACE